MVGLWLQKLLSCCVTLTRVNSTNVQYEGLRIEGVGRRMNSKVIKISQTRYVSKVNAGVNLACFQSVSHRPLLAPIYRWPGLKDREGSDTYYNIDIRHSGGPRILPLGMPHQKNDRHFNKIYLLVQYIINNLHYNM
jgi:hypothetical protein